MASLRSASVGAKFIVPKETRPQLSQTSHLDSVPIIDMNEEPQSLVIEKVSKACQEYGFFQIINHGVPNELCETMLNTLAKFFQLSEQEKQEFFSTDKTKKVRLFNYFLNIQGQDKVTMWSESFAHPWDPLDDDIINLLPLNPPNYREIFTEYAKEIKVVMGRVLSLISKGLGLDENHLENMIGKNRQCNSQSNYYPPCPDPELTLGLATHTDISALTLLLQSSHLTGLQVIKDENWVGVDPVPNAFVINLGDQLQVLSNGRYKSVHHRAVTNKIQTRISLAAFLTPNKETVIGPIGKLIDKENPPVYRHYRFAEFLEEFVRQEGTRRRVKETFELRQLK